MDKETRVFDGQTMRFDLSSTRGVRAPLVFFRVEDAGVNLTMGVVPFDKGRRPRSDLSRYGDMVIIRGVFMSIPKKNLLKHRIDPLSQIYSQRIGQKNE